MEDDTPTIDSSSHSPSSTLTAQQQDELTIKQTEEIEKEITTTTPDLISPQRLPLLSTLEKVFSTDDPIYTAKTRKLATKYSAIRVAKPDGNCFYRALLYALFEKASTSAPFKARLLAKLQEIKEILKVSGYDMFTVEDFQEHFEETLTSLTPGTTPQTTPPSPLPPTPPPTDYLTVYLRITTAAELTRNAAFYSAFLEEQFPDISTFIKTEVEPMGKEADHLQVTALVAIWGVWLRVVYLDRSNSGDDCTELDFGKEEAKGVEKPDVVLLYRPGHYDLVYE